MNRAAHFLACFATVWSFALLERPALAQHKRASVTTTTTLSFSPASPAFGTPVVLTATVTPGTPTGTVTFYDGTAVLGDAFVITRENTAILSTTMLTPGKHSLRAYYGGDSSNAPSGSAKVAVTVSSGDAGGFDPSADSPLAVGTAPVDVEYADLNGDGKNDIVVVNQSANTVTVLLGNGDGTFQPGVPYEVGASPDAAAITDVNADGVPDIIVANLVDGTLSVLLGKGDGTFTFPAQTVTTIASPRSIVVADFNGDGRPDIAVTSVNSNVVAVALNSGAAGFFDPYVTSTVPGTTKGLVIGDFNNDGFADIAVANYTGSANDVSVLLGTGLGTFAAAVSYTTGVSPVGVTTADFNGDGNLDLAVANGGDNTVSVLLGTGTGTFGASVAYPTLGTAPSAITAIDVNGDSLPDLIVVNSGSNNFSVLLDTNTGAFQGATLFPVGNGPRALVAAALTSASLVDVVVANETDNTISILLGAASTTTTLTAVPNPAAPGTDVTLTATVNPLSATGTVSFYDGGTLLGSPVAVVGGVATYTSSSFALGSHTLTAVYTGSGSAADGPSTSAPVVLMILQPTTATLTVAPPAPTLGQLVTLMASVLPTTATGVVTFLDYGSIEIGQAVVAGGQAVLNTSLLGAGPHSITAHYDGDSIDGQSVSTPSAVTVTAAPSGGYGAVTSLEPTGAGPDAVVEGDFNGDGIADLAVANYSNASVSILLGAGGGAFLPAVNYAVGLNPAGIAVGDFNNDGKQDLVVSDNGSAGVSVLLGNGDGTFQPSLFVAAGTLPVGVAVGDFNGDGNLDIAVVDTGSNQVTILPGNGNGIFQAAVNTSIVAGGLRAITVGDFNGDGLPDIAVTDASGVAVLFGAGNSLFGPPANYSAGFGPYAVTTGVFTGSSLDLVVVNSQSNTVSVLLAGTAGTFLPAVTYSVGTFPQAAAVGDFNGDGFLDIAVANQGGNVSILYGNGTGTFQPAVTYAGGTTPTALVAGSFNTSGQTDLAVLNYQSNQVSIYMALLGSSTSLAVAPNPDPAGVPVTFTATVTPSAATGTVTFMDGADTVGSAPVVGGVATLTSLLPAGVQSLTAVYGGDTVYGQSTSLPVLDTVAQAAIVVTLTALPNPSSLNQSVTLVASLNNVNASGKVTFYSGVTVLGVAVVSGGMAQFSTTALPAGSQQLYARYDGDVNDGVAISTALPFTVATVPGFGLGNPTAFATGTSPVSVTAADFNLDGRMDLAVADSTANTLTVLIGNGDGTFAPGVALATGTTPTQVVATDFNGDGIPDLAVSNSGTANITVFLGNGNGTFGAGTSYPAGVAPSSLVIADFNNDGKADVVVANASAAATISFIYGNGDGTLGTTATIPVGDTNTYVAAGDFNNDGNADIAVADSFNNVVWILLGKGNAQFQTPVSYLVGTTPESIAVGDFNGDGKLDLAVANSASSNVVVLLGNGDGTFQTAVQYSTGAQTQSVSVGDFNGDGILDLVAAAQSGTVAVLIGNGNGTFQNAALFPAGATPVSVVVNNFNGDGKDQVAVANKSVNTVSVLLDSTATLNALLGNGESAPLGTTFSTPLEVQVSGFGVPVAGVTVSFAAPSSGASAEFTGTGLVATAVSGSNGIAISPALSANSITGSYTVIASVGTTTVPFTLSNVTSSCTFTVTGGPLAYSSTGGSSTITVTASAPTCTWGASTDSASWVTLSGTGGTGSGSVVVTVAANSSGDPRSGNVFVAGQDFPVTETLTTQVFADVPPTAYYFDSANLLYSQGVTSGCSITPLDYCPSLAVTRAEMAVFIVRSIYGGDNFPYPATPIFNDVPAGSFGFQWIQALSALGITAGCGNGDYCPNDDITRAEMAVFIINARLGPNLPFTYTPTAYFTDVPVGAFAFEYIQRMRQDMITDGCSATTFCPNNPVIRGDMSLFIEHGLFNELFPVGTPVISSVSPATLSPGQQVMMTITGTSTNFQQGLSIVNPIPGVTFGTPTVTGPTSLTVQVVVSTDAAAQPWPIEVVTGTENAVKPNSLMIQ